MSQRVFLVLDVPYLCWRNYYAIKSQLSYGDMPTDVLFGVFRDILSFQDQHATRDLVFCFDRKPYERQKVYPAYKQRSNSLSSEEEESHHRVRLQIKQLREELLYELGYNNVFHQKGYEADDCTASFVKETLTKQDLAVIISADKDLYQLLSANVVLWNPDTRYKDKPEFSESLLLQKYGVLPSQWSEVKAIAGCNSDNIKGVARVGEITACKFVTGKLNPKHKSYQSILDNVDIVRKNMPLVTLPWPGIKKFVLQEDTVTTKKWRDVCQKLGFKSLLRNL